MDYVNWILEKTQTQLQEVAYVVVFPYVAINKVYRCYLLVKFN